jgi:hypothetical protein
MRRIVSALAMAGACTMPSFGGELSVFYCYAPDAASGVVYQSQALPLGPVSERVSYGREFAAYLKSTRRVRADVQAYCVMRSTTDEIARARASLLVESCPECAGATRAESVEWPRPDAGAMSVPSADPARHGSVAPPIERASTNPSKGRPRKSEDKLVVVMGNTESGKLLVVSNQPDLEAVAARQARMIRPTGWKTLLATSEPGFGAAFCVRHGEVTRFFLAHAQPSMKDAISHAREFAAPYAAETAQEVRICGAPWNAQTGEGLSRDEGVIDDLKDAIREEVACDRDAKEGDSGDRPCPARNPSFTGVRG